MNQMNLCEYLLRCYSALFFALYTHRRVLDLLLHRKQPLRRRCTHDASSKTHLANPVFDLLQQSRLSDHSRLFFPRRLYQRTRRLHRSRTIINAERKAADYRSQYHR